MIPESLIPFGLLLVAVIGLWVHRNVWIAALILSVGAGYVTGALRAPALAWIGSSSSWRWLPMAAR